MYKLSQAKFKSHNFLYSVEKLRSDYLNFIEFWKQMLH